MSRMPKVERLAAIAVAAGRSILEVAAAGSMGATAKADDSPVTLADRAAEAIICAALEELYPHIAIVAEERMAERQACHIEGETFFLVDPLDGTKEFIEGRPDYTVNIALVRSGRPVLGVVYAPARKDIYWGSPAGAFLGRVSAGDAIVDASRISVRQRPVRPVVVGSRSHGSPQTDSFARSLGPCEFVAIGSSLKFCLVAAGKADLYPRFGRTMEWDTAAGHAVLLAAGGHVRDPRGEVLHYGKLNQEFDTDFANGAFIAAGASWVAELGPIPRTRTAAPSASIRPG